MLARQYFSARYRIIRYLCPAMFRLLTSVAPAGCHYDVTEASLAALIQCKFLKTSGTAYLQDRSQGVAAVQCPDIL